LLGGRLITGLIDGSDPLNAKQVGQSEIANSRGMSP
jgi:hypothetical protein